MKAKLITDANDLMFCWNILVTPVTVSPRPEELDGVDFGGGGFWSHV